jgi:primosomal protein N' (replication factor Y)
VKGLDFEKVNLVGILDADSLLSFAGFRVNERAFQLMEQVSGRAGRKDADGLVLIQVAQTGHPVLKFVQEHNYNSFFDFELHARKQFAYPPYTRIIHIVCKHRDKQIVTEAIKFIEEGLRADYGKYLVGPAEPIINRIRNQYLMELIIKLPRDTKFITGCKKAIAKIQSSMHQIDKLKNAFMILDVDPL